MSIEDKVVKAQVWDIAGHERLQAFLPIYNRDAAGVLLVYDITQYKTFANAEKRLAEFINDAESNVVVIMVGNKSDLESMRAVPQEEAREFAKKYGLMWMETSALESSRSIEEAFKRLLTEITKNFQKKQEDSDGQN